MLTLNLNLLYTVVNVLILFLLLRKFLYKPVMGIIAQRQKQVDDALNAAETSKKEAAAAMNAAQDKLRNVDTEAAARRETYEQQAETAKQQLLAEAQKQADAIVAEATFSSRSLCFSLPVFIFNLLFPGLKNAQTRFFVNLI